MGETIPWWGSGLFTVVGAVLGSLGALILGLLDRRRERYRLSRSRKETDYPELVTIAGRLAQLPVWPADTQDPHTLYAALDTLAQRIAFFSPLNVSRTLSELLSAAGHVADTVTEIRSGSRPTHDSRVDQRYAPRHRAAADRLDQAIGVFATAARADLEIRTHYLLIRPTEDTRTPTSAPQS